MTQGLEPFDDEFLQKFGERFESSFSRRSEQELDIIGKTQIPSPEE